MCRRIPFHYEANACTDDLTAWRDMYLAMPPEHQADETSNIRRTIVLETIRRRISGETTRVHRPSVIPEMAEE